MLLAIDVGNSNTVLGPYQLTGQASELIADWRITTPVTQTASECGIVLQNLFSLNHLEMSVVDGIVISSVVPPLDPILRQVCELYFHLKPLFIEPGVKTGLPILTDVHTEVDIPAVAAVVDVLQTPAFLCRQTDFIRAVAQKGKPVNIKKGQFLAPHDMKNVIDKARAAARDAGLPEDNFMACERGASFGYNNLVSDMRSLAIMRETGAPVVFDATHSVQLPGGQGTSSGGMREMVPVLSRAAVAVGVAGLFMETHPNPAVAMSDGPNAVPLHHMKALLETLLELDAVTKKNPFLENIFN